jgi:hypothetical protein
MTIRDIQASFTDAAVPYVDITGAAGTYLAPNSIDTSPLGGFFTEQTASDTQLSANINTGRDLGASEHLWLMVDMIVAPTGGTSVDFQLITSASASMSSPNVLYDSTAIVIATLVKGFRIKIDLPDSASYLQWLGLQAITVGTMTAGRFMAWIGSDAETLVSGYASGFSVK